MQIQDSPFVVSELLNRLKIFLWSFRNVQTDIHPVFHIKAKGQRLYYSFVGRRQKCQYEFAIDLRLKIPADRNLGETLRAFYILVPQRRGAF